MSFTFKVTVMKLNSPSLAVLSINDPTLVGLRKNTFNKTL